MSMVFRVDASLQIGTGHVMRCLTYAAELRLHGVDVVFICREHPGNLISLIEGKGYPVVCLQKEPAEYVPRPEDVAHASWLGASWEKDAAATIAAVVDDQPLWLIVDHYGIDCRWEHKLRAHVGKIMVIDDLADRPHDCDLLLDQNFYQAMETRYDHLVSRQCKKFLGPKYVLLRPEFAVVRKSLRQRDGSVRRVFVFFGGVDSSNETKKALQALSSADLSLEVEVVVGAHSPHNAEIQAICDQHHRFNYHCSVDNMAELMATADLAIGAGGCSMWERCYVGLPAITVVSALNQQKATEDAAGTGAIMYLGQTQCLNAEDYANAIACMIDNPQIVRQITAAALGVLSSSGAAVVETMLTLD